MELEIENRDTLFNHHYFYDHYWQFGMEGNHSDLVQLPSSHAFETYHQQWHHTKEDPAGHHFSVNQMVSFSKIKSWILFSKIKIICKDFSSVMKN